MATINDLVTTIHFVHFLFLFAVCMPLWELYENIWKQGREWRAEIKIREIEKQNTAQSSGSALDF